MGFVKPPDWSEWVCASSCCRKVSSLASADFSFRLLNCFFSVPLAAEGFDDALLACFAALLPAFLVEPRAIVEYDPVATPRRDGFAL